MKTAVEIARSLHQQAKRDRFALTRELQELDRQRELVASRLALAKTTEKRALQEVAGLEEMESVTQKFADIARDNQEHCRNWWK